MMNLSLAILATAIELGTVGLRLAIFAGAFAALMAVVVLIVNRLLKRWLSPAQKCLLWGLVLIRLLILWGPASAWSLQHLLLPSASTPAVAYPDLAIDSVPNAVAASAHMTASSPPLPMATSLRDDILEMLDAALPLMWLTGALFVIARTVVLQWKFSRRVKAASEFADGRLLRLWTECCVQAGLRREVPVIVCDAVQQPAVMGLLRPKLLLPSEIITLDDDQLRLIMRHELAHIKRHDVASNWLLVCVQALQWWNPVYWLAASRFSNYREQACDAFVLRQSTGVSQRSYCELILTLAGRQTSGGWRVSLPVSLLGFLPAYLRKRAVRERLRALGTTRSGSRITRPVAVATLAIVGVICGLTSATPPQEVQTREYPAITVEGSTAEIAAELEVSPAETKTYDLSKLLARLHWDDPKQTQHLAIVEHLVANLARAPHADQLLSTSASSPRELAGVPTPSVSNCKLIGEELTVHAPANTQAQIADLLKTWEASGLGQISVECRFITAEQDIATAAGLVWQYHEADSALTQETSPLPIATGAPRLRATTSVREFVPVGIAALTAKQTRRLLDRGQSDRRVNVLQAPKLTLFNGQTAGVVDITQRPFVVGTKADRQGTQQPNLCVLEEGIKVTFRPVHSVDQSQVRFSGRLEFSSIDDVRKSQMMVAGKPTAVEIPSARQFRIDIACDVPDGDSVLIACMPKHLEKHILYTLLTVRTLTEPRGEGRLE